MLKKLLSLLLAGMLCTGLALPAFASSDMDREDALDEFLGDDDREDEDGDAKLRSIRLSNSSIRLSVGDEGMQLFVVYTPSAAYEDVEWSSRNSDIATVDDDGNITAVNEGRTVITVKSESGMTASCSVEVRDGNGSGYDYVDRVEMNLDELTVRRGETRQLMADVSPDDLPAEDRYITWTSGDPEIAGVEADGTVYGVALGSTTIYATADNGEYDTCRVTVVDSVAGGMVRPASTSAAKPASSSATRPVTGSLSSADVRSNVEQIADATRSGAVGIAAFADSGVISQDLRTAAASAAGSKNVVLRFATTDSNKKRLGYMTIDPKAARNVENDMDTTVLLAGKEVDAAEKTFDKYYQNETKALYLTQVGSFGVPVTIQAKLDLTGMDPDNLVFYSYVNNGVTKLAVQTYSVDANGFVRFTTGVGGIVIVSDGALVK